MPDNGTNTYTPGRGGLRGEIILFQPQFLNFYIRKKVSGIVLLKTEKVFSPIVVVRCAAQL